MRLLLYISSFLLIAVFSGAYSTAYAQKTHGVTPRLIEEETPPGTVIRETITVTNTHPYVINVFPSVHGLSAGSEQRILPASDTPFLDWTAMTRAAQRLQPGASTTIDVTFTVDRAAAPGTYQALLGFGQGIDRPTAEAAVVQGTAPAVVVRFAIPEPRVDTAAAASFRTAPFVVFPEQAAIFYTVQNPSRESIVPQGEILIYNNRGAEIVAVPLNPDLVTIAPGEVFRFATTSPVVSWLGRYDARARVDFGTAQLASVTLQDGYWYVPWYVILLCICLLLFLSVYVYRKARRAMHHGVSTHDAAVHLPFHVYHGESAAEDHDINLKQ